MLIKCHNWFVIQSYWFMWNGIGNWAKKIVRCFKVSYFLLMEEILSILDSLEKIKCCAKLQRFLFLKHYIYNDFIANSDTSAEFIESHSKRSNNSLDDKRWDSFKDLLLINTNWKSAKRGIKNKTAFFMFDVFKKLSHQKKKFLQD